MLAVVIAVKHIAYHNYLPGAVKLYGLHEPLHVFFKNILWNAYAMFAKMPALAKMHIANDQSSLFLPKNSSEGRKNKAIIKNMMNGQWTHTAKLMHAF